MCFDCAGSRKVCAAGLVCGILPAHFRIYKLKCILTAQAGTKSGPRVGLRHFTSKFPYKVVLKCISTAQARTKYAPRVPGSGTYFPVNFRTTWLL